MSAGFTRTSRDGRAALSPARSDSTWTGRPAALLRMTADLTEPSDLAPVNVAARRRDLLVVLASSGAVGFLLGELHPSWHDALEPAQVLAGLVRYPIPTPVYLYSVQTWTVIHQVLALALLAGLSE